jgi:hypothetical protein
MGATLRKLDDAPVLIVTHEGYINLKSVEEITVKIAEVLAASDVPIYGIIDTRGAYTDLSELLRILYHQTVGAAGTMSAEKDRIVLVGTHPLIRVFRKLFHLDQFGGRIIPIFTSMEEALIAVHARVEADARAHAVAQP